MTEQTTRFFGSRGKNNEKKEKEHRPDGGGGGGGRYFEFMLSEGLVGEGLFLKFVFHY
jgi:hypothetical protein